MAVDELTITHIQYYLFIQFLCNSFLREMLVHGKDMQKVSGKFTKYTQNLLTTMLLRIHAYIHTLTHIHMYAVRVCVDTYADMYVCMFSITQWCLQTCSVKHYSEISL